MSFVNGEAVEKARLFRKGGNLKSSENIEDIFKNKEKRDEFFNNSDIKSLAKSLYKDTNNKNKDIAKLDLESPLHKIIRDKD